MSAIQPGRRAGDRAPVRIAVVGAGAMGSLHARVVAESTRARLYAVVDADLTRAEAIAERVGCLATSDLEVAGRCDAVIVATPTETHLEVALPLLQAGIPVLIEKPVASTYDDVLTLTKEAEARGVVLKCGFVERFNAVVNLATELLDSPPVHLVAMRHSPPNPRASTSVLADLLVHDIDLALHFGGFARPEGVIGTAWTPPGGQFAEIADSTLRFPDGMVATLSASRKSQRKIRSIMVTTATTLIELDLLRQNVTVYRHVMHDEVPGSATGYRAQTVVDIPFVRHAGEPLFLQFEHFLDLILGVADAAEERRRLLPAHEVLARLEDQV
jgi:predicted dehydrogenase